LAQRLLPHLQTRFVFSVGKGGVGKTTTAGALALAFAESGERTCLISTDPAHSLGDLFQVALAPGRPTVSPCSPLLSLEELDADGYAHRWMERARQPLTQLFQEGSYLEEEDVRGFLDLTLPGVDEVAGVMRLSEMAESPFDRIVVDTAPTGHTLRLLDAGHVVSAWTEAFDAMAEKASAVISQLMRRPVRVGADDLIDELRVAVERFDERVLASGAALLVERAGTVVQQETDRLQAALRARGLRVAVRARVASWPEDPAVTPGAPARVVIPFNPNVEGCDGLARWGELAPLRSRDTAARLQAPAMQLLADLPPLLLFVGKGGVGKSTCSAAAALALSETEPVTLLGTDPAAALGSVLAVPLGADALRLTEALEVRQVQGAQEFEQLGRRYRTSVQDAFRSLGLGGAELDQRVVAALLGLAPPGVDELFAVVALLERDESGSSKPRRVVLDAAPSGHFLRLAAMPRTALEWTHQLLRVVRKYRRVLKLDAFAERLLDFAKGLKDLDLRLSDPERSAAIVVTQAGPLVTAESHRLVRRLEESGIRIGALLANRVSPGFALPSPSAREPLMVAPLMEEAPVGVRALRDFARTWRVAERTS
jgi:arsenite/tail-anchored protein-transporting ATPase